MRIQSTWILTFLFLLTGCRTTHRAAAPVPTAVQSVPVSPPAPVASPLFSAPTVPTAPATSGYFVPQGGCATCPPGTGSGPVTQGPAVATPAPPPPVRPMPSNNQGQAAPSQVQLAPPEPLAADQGFPPPATPAMPGKTKESKRVQPSLPAGIPNFTSAREGVTAGLRPTSEEGFEWLKTNGYKAVLHIRLPGESNDLDRQQVEKHGLKYLTIEVSPQSLEQGNLEEFARMVRNPALQPLFVYDRDGALSGVLWYWFFRAGELQPEEAARLRAESLGLRENREGLHRDMWLALQKLLR